MCERQNLVKIMKKALNISFLKFQQSTINVKSLNVHALFLNMCSLKILNSEKKIKKKNSVFMKINVIQQQKMKSEFLLIIMFNLKNKIIKKHLQYHVKLFFMKSAKENSY